MNDVTVATVEQGLLNNIQLTLNHTDPVDVYLEETHMAVTAYSKFQEALLVKTRQTINS